ncbi:CCAAT/enhancer-binding protein [Phlebotomus argentipes]|uniref:CCAAT/enhancer-binding protein n=1 Tax=Phlebotomus argentipes TaxID=94469 RepID=UPI002892A718|nr:CCAAT/enhancer-binding protein [Phlebotomus argentipes]
MESPQMYDSSQPIQIEVKKITMASNATVTNNNTSNINHNMVKQQQQQQLQQQQTNGSILQKHMLQQYSQSDLEELTSQEISLDLQHLIDDQFRDQESMGIFTEMVSPTNGTPNGVNAAAKALQIQQGRLQAPQGYPRTTLAYMPQPVHSGATYTNNSSDENSSVGSDATTSIKEEPVDPAEYRRQLANGQFMPAAPVQNGANGAAVYPNLPPNYASNGSGNTFTTLTPSTVLHHQALPHLPSAAHLANLKHKQMMSHRKQSNKHVDKGTDEYRRRRERNNIAVRKSREKAKVRSREVEEKVKTLIKEKEVLIRRLEEMTNEIQLHKQLYMHLINHSNPEINQICRSVLSVVNMSDHGM